MKIWKNNSTEIVCDLQIYESNFNRFACSWLVLTALKTKIITLLPSWALDFVAPLKKKKKFSVDNEKMVDFWIEPGEESERSCT